MLTNSLKATILLIKYIFIRALAAGEYLALTGDKLNGAEMIACGLATHYSLDAVSSF